jgi:polyisoprenoid-binding protein YceI
MIFNQILKIAMVIAGLSVAGNWKADSAKAEIGFTVKGLFGTVHGSFSGLVATVQFNEKDLPGSSISASVDAKTVSTGISLRNSDLRNKEEWFNTEKFPRIIFHSKKIEKTAGGYKALGDLTIKGVTKSTEIPFTFTSKGGAGLFKGEFTVKRSDYNLGKPGGSVGSIISVALTVPVNENSH